MVFEDLSEVQPVPNQPRLAPVADRVLSVLADVTLFWPLFSLFLAGLLRKLQYRYYASPDSTEFWVLLGIVVFAYSALTIFSQGLFWSVFGATPGQFFFQLRVVRARDQKFPTLHAAWLRSFLFWLECCCLGIPLLEVFSHPDRRAFHDRASECEVITLKKIGMDRPHRIETHFIRSFFTVCLAFALMWAFAGVSHLYRKVTGGAYKEAELSEADRLCAEVPQRDIGSRLDSALAMYAAGELSPECLSTEIDFAFWRGENEDQAWASFANAVLNEHDKALSDAYLKQTCEKAADSGACSLSRWWKSKDVELPSLPESWTRSVLAVQRFDRERNLEEWQNNLRDLPEDFDLAEFVETEKVKLLWAQNKSEQARGGYSVVFDHLSSSGQRDLASELCLSELTETCEVRSYKFCRDLEGTLRQEMAEEVKPEWIIALAEEKACRKASSPNLLELTRYLDPETSWGKLLLALVPESEWSESKRIEELRKIAFAAGAPAIAKARAFVQLLRSGADLTDLEKGQALMADRGLPYRKEIESLFTKTAQKQGFHFQEREPASLEAK